MSQPAPCVTFRIALLAALSLAAGACSSEPEAPAVVGDIDETFESLPEDATGERDAAQMREPSGAQASAQGKASGSNPPDAKAPDPGGSKLIKADPPR